MVRSLGMYFIFAPFSNFVLNLDLPASLAEDDLGGSTLIDIALPRTLRLSKLDN